MHEARQRERKNHAMETMPLLVQRGRGSERKMHAVVDTYLELHQKWVCRFINIARISMKFRILNLDERNRTEPMLLDIVCAAGARRRCPAVSASFDARSGWGDVVYVPALSLHPPPPHPWICAVQQHRRYRHPVLLQRSRGLFASVSCLVRIVCRTVPKSKRRKAAEVEEEAEC